MNNIQLIEYWILNYPKKAIKESKDYYKGDNKKIHNREMKFIAEGAMYDDIYKANEKVSKNDYRTIVDQLTGYVLGKQPTIEGLKTNAFDAVPEKNLWLTVKKALKQTQIQSISWAQPYIKNGKLKYTIHKNSENIIPIYKDRTDDELEKVIYYYDVNVLVKNEVKQAVRAEVWDESTVTYYENIDGDGWGMINAELDNNDLDINPMPHVLGTVEYENGTKVVTTSNTWGRVPFIPLVFNDEEQTMLEVIGKNKIDALDYLLSDGCNNFLDLADAIYILEGYQGDVSEALKNLKTKKAVAVGEGGNVKQMSNEIPMVSRKSMIDIVQAAIYSDGQAVNLDALKGGSLTNVVIQAWFTALDLKADNIIPEIEEFYGTLLDFATLFANGFKDTNYEMPNITFNKAMIMNVNEAIKSANESVGNISEETRLANDPRVTDPKEEIKRMQLEEVDTYDNLE